MTDRDKLHTKNRLGELRLMGEILVTYSQQVLRISSDTKHSIRAKLQSLYNEFLSWYYHKPSSFI